MLQISTGKLYQNGFGRENALTGVMYSNLRIIGDKKIQTVAGSILPTSHLSNSMALIYEFSEKMEKEEAGPGVLISHGVDPYILDFSAIASFALNCIVTSDYDLAHRLKSNQRGLSTPTPPNELVTRFFDSEILLKPEDELYLVKFVEQLLGLKRVQFLGVMRAIRNYVTGMHRIADDLELAYTLIVASIESLAQDFDGHDSTWDDLDQRKRKILDDALINADTNTVNQVKSAVLQIEHTALSKRFKSFTIQNISSSFFREGIEGLLNPITRSDLSAGLSQAYTARSKYIHNLRELPKGLTLGGLPFETMSIENKTWFTLQGISRIARHVITEFIFKQETIENEIYNYRLERSGIVTMQFAPHYWIGNPDNLKKDSGSKRLEGFLQQLVQFLINEPNYVVTDLIPVLEVIESQLPQMKKDDRLPFVTLYLAFNSLLPEERKMEGYGNIEKKFVPELKEPSAVSLIYHLLFTIVPDWKLSTHHETIMTYFKSRDNKRKIRIPRLLEAGLILSLADRCKELEEYDDAEKHISFALENFPENIGLREFEKEYLADNKREINWKEILLPNEDEAKQSDSED